MADNRQPKTIFEQMLQGGADKQRDIGWYSIRDGCNQTAVADDYRSVIRSCYRG